MTLGYKWAPVVGEDLCTGCGVCVDACGPRFLEIADGVAVLPRPHNCGADADSGM